MALLAPPMLHKIVAVLYGLITPGHIIVGSQKVYPALDKIPSNDKDAHGGRTGAQLCWNFVTTALLAQAAMHWKWSRTGASGSTEEAVALLGLTSHILWNGVQYLRIGEAAGPLLIVAAATGMTALVADLHA